MCRKHGISEATGRASCPPHDGAEISDAAGPKGHEDMNARLKWQAAEARLDAPDPAPVARHGIHQGVVAPLRVILAGQHGRDIAHRGGSTAPSEASASVSVA